MPFLGFLFLLDTKERFVCNRSKDGAKRVRFFVDVFGNVHFLSRNIGGKLNTFCKRNGFCVDKEGKVPDMIWLQGTVFFEEIN